MRCSGSADAAANLLHRERGIPRPGIRAGLAVLGMACGGRGNQRRGTLDYALHPEYTFVNAAERLTRYIDEHPNGKRLLVSVSGDEITLVTHLPALNDLFTSPSGPMPDLATKLAIISPAGSPLERARPRHAGGRP
jgi:hypothetical protein